MNTFETYIQAITGLGCPPPYQTPSPDLFVLAPLAQGTAIFTRWLSVMGWYVAAAGSFTGICSAPIVRPGGPLSRVYPTYSTSLPPGLLIPDSAGSLCLGRRKEPGDWQILVMESPGVPKS